MARELTLHVVMTDEVLMALHSALYDYIHQPIAPLPNLVNAIASLDHRLADLMDSKDEAPIAYVRLDGV